MGTEDADDNGTKTLKRKAELASVVNDIEMTDSREPPLRNFRHSPPGVGLKPEDSTKPLYIVRGGAQQFPSFPVTALGVW